MLLWMLLVFVLRKAATLWNQVHHDAESIYIYLKKWSEKQWEFQKQPMSKNNVSTYEQ